MTTADKLAEALRRIADEMRCELTDDGCSVPQWLLRDWLRMADPVLTTYEREKAGQAELGVPENCRQRLMRDGKPYARSSCFACGSLAPRWKACDKALGAHP